MEKIQRYTPPAFISLVFLLTYICLYFGAMPLFADPDVSWHLATGNLILREGKLPETDTWSFASAGQHWYIISWLWDVVIELIHRGFGLGGVFVFAMVALSALASLVAHSLLRRRHIGNDALFFTLLLVGISLIEFASPRPHIIGYFCIVLTHMILHNSRVDVQSRALYFLPALMIAWVNMHGSFLAGFTLIGAYGLEALVNRRWIWFRNLFVIGVLCLAATFANPYGTDVYAGVLRTLNSVMTQYIIEWRPFELGASVSLSVVFLLFLCTGPLREARVPLADKILSLIWLIAMLFSMRNAMIFLLVSAPTLAISLQSFCEQSNAARPARVDILQLLSDAKIRWKMALAAVIAVALSVFLQPMLKGESLLTAKNDIGPAVSWLKEHATGKRILNDYDYGGRIAYETRGAVSLYVDGRAGTAYPEATLQEYIGFFKQTEGWEKIITKYRIDVILVNNESLFAQAYGAGKYRQKWKEVYRDKVASIYLRK